MAENVRIVKNELDQGVDHYEPSSGVQHGFVLEATASFAVENFIEDVLCPTFFEISHGFIVRDRGGGVLIFYATK